MSYGASGRSVVPLVNVAFDMVNKFRVLEITKEFLRYVVVGGAAFVADLTVLVAVRELFLKPYPWGVYVAAVIGFMAGLAVNYVLSIKFCFVAAKEGKGRTVGAFILFAVICVLGLVFTEIGMWIGVEIFRWHYVVVKVLVAGIVLIWNYSAKKILIFTQK